MAALRFFLLNLCVIDYTKGHPQNMLGSQGGEGVSLWQWHDKGGEGVPSVTSCFSMWKKNNKLTEKRSKMTRKPLTWQNCKTKAISSLIYYIYYSTKGPN